MTREIKALREFDSEPARDLGEFIGCHVYCRTANTNFSQHAAADQHPKGDFADSYTESELAGQGGVREITRYFSQSYSNFKIAGAAQSF